MIGHRKERLQINAEAGSSLVMCWACFFWVRATVGLEKVGFGPRPEIFFPLRQK